VAPDGELSRARSVGGATSMGWGLAEAWHADALAQLGRFDEALVHATAAMQVGKEANHAWQEFRGMIDLGRTHLRRGDVPRAIETLEGSLELSRTHQFAFGTPFAAASLAAAYGLAGRGDEALALVAEPLAALRKRNDYSRPTLVLICAVIANLTAGRLDEAASLAQETVALTRQLGAPGFRADALRLAGQVAAAVGNDDDALGYYREALALGDRLGMRPVLAHSHLGLGRLAWRAGRRDEARVELTAAVALLREMGMSHWLPDAEAMLRAAELP
jgi:tetratricopeptide (TPR) repeat protein